MRLCLIQIVFITLITISIGCSSPKVVPKPIQVETKVESNADGILVTALVIEPFDIQSLSELATYGSALENQLKTRALQMEGIEVRKVSAVDIPAIIASIGRVATQENVWHGQIFKWRDVQQHQVPYQGMVVAKSGIPYFIDSGFLSLLARSWLVEREDGLFVYLQLLPSWHVPSKQSLVAGRSARPSQSKLFTELGLEILLSDGEAVILGVELKKAQRTDGPLDDGPSPVRLGEAMFGLSASREAVVLLVIESNILPRG